MIGRLVGAYRVTAKLGEGGMGAVYRARDEMLQRPVALKVLRPELASERAIVDRFRTEAVALARLNHPNIATVYGLIEQHGELFMVMEFVEGRTVEAVLASQGRLPVGEAVRVGRAVLDALEHAHGMGVIHRDLKPANLMLTRSGLVKVMDFGIARLAGTSRHTEYGRIVGTPLYMSPEQLRGEEVDPRSDVYALGIVLYELLTGQEAFQADSDYEMLLAQVSRMPARPLDLRPDLPPALDAVVMQALCKVRADRFPSAAAFRRALAPFDAPVGESTGTPVETAATAPPTRLAEPVWMPPPPTRIAASGGAPISPTRIAAVGGALAPIGAWLRRYLSNGPRRYAAGAAAALLVVLMIRGVAGGKPAPAAVAMEEVLPTLAPEPESGGGPGSGSPDPGFTDRPIVPPPPIVTGLVPAAPPPASPRPRPTPAPSPPPAATVVESAPAPRSETAATPAVPAARDADFARAMARVGELIQARDLASLDRSYHRSAAQDRTNWETLERLLGRFNTRLEGVAPAGAGAGTTRPRAEYTGTLQWRTAFGSTRRAPVRIEVMLAHEGGGWTLHTWRLLGAPDLN